MSIAVFTSITLNYLPKAQILARSLKRHHPAMRFHLVVSEPVAEDLCAYEPAFDAVITPADLSPPPTEGWLFQHKQVELCTAVKSRVLDELLSRPEVEAVLYLDPDTKVFSPLTPVLESLRRADLVLTPHLCEPETDRQAILDNELCALKHGVYNLGFFAVSTRPEGRRFARWWRDRLDSFCRDDMAAGMYTDQRWIDLAPPYFPTCEILRHPGCNVATWNLTRRRVTGTESAGYAVNGQPLVFYHFSGFDSGAQWLMLRRFTSDQPAVLELRRRYIAETAAADARGYHRRRWAGGCYDNGVPIRVEHRRLYRDRPDLQERFPHPFATHDDSYWAWLDRPAEPPMRAESGPTPLERYVADPDLWTCSPHPGFQADFYAALRPDVGVARVNPLIHYLEHGEAENTPPHPDFDPAFVRTTRRVSAGASLLAAHEIEGRSGRTHPRFDRRRDEGWVRAMRERLATGKPVILRIGHDGGGGTGVSIRRKQRLLSDRAEAVALWARPPDRTVLSLPQHPDLPEMIFDDRSAMEDRIAVLRELGVTRVHVHHVLYNERWLPEFLERAGWPYDITLHDYYFISPQPHLLDESDRFVGDDRLDDEILTRPYWPGVPVMNLVDWRRAHRVLLANAARLMAPSRDVVARYRRVFPEFDYRVVPHPESPRPERQPVRFQSCAEAAPLRVVLLGAMQPHKGSRVLVECARRANAAKAPLEFIVLGTLEEAPPPSVAVHGVYRAEELEALIGRWKPHLAWFPAQCPETYSNTLSEAMAAGLPVLASDLGAFPERLAGRAWSWLFPWKAEPVAWLNRMLDIRARHFVRGEPHALLGPAPDGEDRFYSEEYLAEA